MTGDLAVASDGPEEARHPSSIRSVAYTRWVFLRALALSVIVAASWPSRAGADPAAEAEQLAREGRELGDGGDFAAAIDRFKAAYRLAPLPKYTCNIGLAYSKLGKWAPAQLFLARCRRDWGATLATPVPAFVGVSLPEIEARLQRAAFARVELVCTPADARILVAALDPDEAIGEHAFWLPVGAHELEVSRQGFVTQRIAVEVAAAQRPVRVEIELREVAPAAPALMPGPADPVVSVRRQSAPRSSSSLRWVALGIGTAATVGGAGLHWLALQTRADARELTVAEGFAEKNDTYRWQRAAALGAYAVGAGGLALATYLWVRSRGGEDHSASVALTPAPGGAMVWLGWSR